MILIFDDDVYADGGSALLSGAFPLELSRSSAWSEEALKP